jgi:hypothetical protein
LSAGTVPANITEKIFVTYINEIYTNIVFIAQDRDAVRRSRKVYQLIRRLNDVS